MYMGLQNPDYIEIVFANKSDDGVSRSHVGSPSGIIKIEYRIYNRAGTAIRVLDDIAKGVRRLIKKVRNDWALHRCLP